MSLTTIKVDHDLRDRLRTAAAARGQSMGAHIAALLDEEDRRARFAAVREAMAASPPDAAYRLEAEEWQADTGE